MSNEIIILTDVALITCMVPRGNADAIVAAARAAGAQGASIHYGRGAGVRERLGILSITVEAEKEVVQIMVSKQQQEDVFAAMYHAGNFNTPGMGLMFVTPLERAATFVSQAIKEQVLNKKGITIMLDMPLESAKWIVCTVPQGLGADIAVKLYEQSEVINIQHHTGRGQYAHDASNEWQEIDTLVVLVKEAFADDVFRLMYHLTDMHSEEGSYIYQAHLPMITPFKLPLMHELIEDSNSQG